MPAERGMKLARASLHDGLLTVCRPGREQMVALGSAWMDWLEQPNTTAFRCHAPGMRFTAPELQRGHPYW